MDLWVLMTHLRITSVSHPHALEHLLIKVMNIDLPHYLLGYEHSGWTNYQADMLQA